jgi:hypothetical protein
LSQVAHPRWGGESRYRAPEVAKGRHELTTSNAVQSDILSMPIKPTHQNKKMSKMKGGPNKLMKKNGQISDKMAEAD